MEPNPYQPPRSPDPPSEQAESKRKLFRLAGIGAGLAGGYWALIGAGMALGSASGSISAGSLFAPVLAIAFYGSRAYRIFKGDAGSAVRDLVWLHAIGLIAAAIRMFSGSTLLIALQGVKIAIHIFGGVTAYLAKRSEQQS